MAYDTDTQGLMVAFASMEAAQRALAQDVQDNADRNVERLEALAEKLDERHEALTTLLEEREEGRDEREAARDEAMRAFVRDVVREALAPMHVRLDAVEQKQRQITWIGGALVSASGVLAWMWEHFGKYVAPVLFLAVLSCAHLPEATKMRAAYGWPTWRRPVRLAIASDITPECFQALMAGLRFWQSQGVDYLEPHVVPAAELVPGLPIAGTIAVVTASVKDPESLGETFSVHDSWGSQAAEIRLARCRAQTAAHELGHALAGPAHSVEPANLMYYGADLERDDQWGLTAAQVAAVR